MGHPVAKGDSAETVWLELFERYLPRRYQAAKAFVVDSEGVFSQQLDLVIYDRQYSPLVFEREGQRIIPAESVYAVFEAKQSIDAQQVSYAQKKVASVRGLHRTSLPVPHVEGTAAAKPLHQILGGILTLDSEWTPPPGEALLKALEVDTKDGLLDIGCVAAHGGFEFGSGKFLVREQAAPATAFILELIARLQAIGTVPMLDVRAYARWL
jgi:hypothetical protein